MLASRFFALPSSFLTTRLLALTTRPLDPASGLLACTSRHQGFGCGWCLPFVPWQGLSFWRPCCKTAC